MMKNMMEERQDNEISRRTQTQRLAELLQHNRTIARCMEEEIAQNEERVNLLVHILRDAEHTDREELTRQIYLYGSMLTSKDLAARQMFLWLAAMGQERQ